MPTIDKQKVEASYNQKLNTYQNKHAMLDAHPDWLRANEFHHYASLHYVLQYLKPRASKRILDYGCGIGRLAVPLAKAGAEVWAVDTNQKAIEIALKQQHQKVNFKHIQDSEALLQLTNTPFDQIIIYGVLCHVDDADIQKLFCVFEKILKPGGSLFLFELVENAPNGFVTDDYIRRSITEWHTLIENSPFKINKHKRLLRWPSYARHYWVKWHFLPHFTLPLMLLFEKITLNRKPYYIEYSIDLMELKRK